LDIVVCTEHNFKRPKESFLQLLKQRPENHKTILLPGVEATTKEGIDIILFSDTEQIYQEEDLLIPQHYSIPELLKRLKHSKHIRSIVAHPNVLMKQGMLSNLGEKKYLKYFKRFDLVEKHNACLNEVLDMVKVFKEKKFYKNLLKIKELPEKYILNKGFTVGSDAHHVEEIGTFLEIDTSKKPENLSEFMKILKSKIKRRTHFLIPQNKLLSLYKKTTTSVAELVQSKIYNIRSKKITKSKWQMESMLKESKNIWKSSSLIKE